jgi:isocitrate/isopropylmalate dehydrogenase
MPGDAKTRLVTVLPGHGVGPELVASAMRVIKATNAPIAFEIVDNIVDKVSPLKRHAWAPCGDGSRRSAMHGQ